MFSVLTPYLRKLLREEQTFFLISIMYPDKFAFLILEHKIRTRGVTSSQSQTSNIAYILPFPEV